MATMGKKSKAQSTQEKVVNPQTIRRVQSKRKEKLVSSSKENFANITNENMNTKRRLNIRIGENNKSQQAGPTYSSKEPINNNMVEQADLLKPFSSKLAPPNILPKKKVFNDYYYYCYC